jgi:20S proteasome subunit beta 6
MSTAAAAQLMSVTLYYKRFFPYYAFCMIAGLDETGKDECQYFARIDL